MVSRNTILCSAACLSLGSFAAVAQEVAVDVDLTVGQVIRFGVPVGELTTGNNLSDRRNLSTISDTNPVLAAVEEDSEGALFLSIIGGSSDDPSASEVRASGLGLGVSGPSSSGGTTNLFRFDSTANESLVLAFNADVWISSIELGGIQEDEVFGFGSVTGITRAFEDTVLDAGAGNVTFSDFDLDGVTDDTDVLFFAAGTGIEVRAVESLNETVGGVAGISLRTISLTYDASTLIAPPTPEPDIPEPSSLALLGLGGLLIARRRRS